MTPLEVLTKARDLISDPSKWTQKTDALDSSGHECGARDPHAVRWCSYGVLRRIEDDAGPCEETPAVAALRTALRNSTGTVAIAEYNDTKTHADVVALFDSAIELARAQSALAQ